MKTAYRIEHCDSNIYCVEAYGIDHHPIFAARDEAVDFMRRCVEAWPADAPARDMYSIEEYDSVEAAMADGHGQVVQSVTELNSRRAALGLSPIPV